jgi:hypothetical protein
MTEIEDARAGLSAIADSRQRLAVVARVPMWRHALFAGMMGGLVAAYGLPVAYQMGAVAGLLCATAVIVREDRKRMGMFLNGYRRGRTSPIAYASVAFFLVSLVLAIVLRRTFAIAWAPFAIAAIVAAVGWKSSIAWERAYLRELGATGHGR